MPNIKFKPFALSSVLCYRCGQEIKQGMMNWTYNTRSSGMFRHQSCTMTEQQFKEEVINHSPESEPTPELKHQPADTTPIPAIPSYSDITDLITLEGKHFEAERIKKALALREYPFLTGAPGAGKTHLALTLAQDMGLDFVMISCSNDMFKSEMLGSVSPVSGSYYATAFYHAWENGGLILMDEVCLASGAFLNVLNAGLEQKEIRFPNGKRVHMHKNCMIMFADNSAGYGNDPQFPERQDIGGAFRDRICYIEFAYDLKVELKVITSILDGDSIRATQWHETVKRMRAELEPLSVPVFASPRFAYKAARWFRKERDLKAFDQAIEQYFIRAIDKTVRQIVTPIVNKYRRVY